MDTIHKTLQQFGLSEADVNLYLVLNSLGESDIPTITHKTNLSRTAIYDSINSLTEHNLIIHRKIGRSAYYNTTHPQELERLITKKKQREAQLERTMQASIQELIKTYNLVSNRPGIYYFSGKEEIIKMYEDFYQENEPVDSIEEKGEMLKFLGDYCYTYVEKRIQHRMYNRCIAPDSNTMNYTDPKKLREVRIVPTTLFPFRMDIKIAGSKTVLVTFDQNKAMGVLIDNPEIAANFKILFNFLWTMIDRSGLGDPRPQERA